MRATRRSNVSGARFNHSQYRRLTGDGGRGQPVITRRSLLEGAAIVCACHICSILSVQAQDQGGCYLAPQEAAAKRNENNAFASDKLSSSPNDPSFTKDLGLALVRLSKFFNVRPAFGFYSDNNASASESIDENVPGTWGTVLVGRPLLANELNKDSTGMTVLAVLAHEFGHIVQFTYNIKNAILANQPSKKRLELHADILAGYYFGCRKRETPTLSVYSAGAIFDRLGDSDFTSPEHHGTNAERRKASQFGFDRGHQSQILLSQMVSEGMSYVSSS